MATESFKKAIKIIQGRQQKAKAAALLHRSEVLAKIPSMKNLLLQLAQTGTRLSKAVFSSDTDNNGLTITQVVEMLRAENQEIQLQKGVLLEAHGYDKDYLEVQFYCKKCEDTGYVQGKKCDCLKELISELNAIEFNSNSRITPCTFEQFSLEYYSKTADDRGVSPYDRMTDVLAFCKAYAKHFDKTAPSVLMVGETGLGKTHLSLSIADVLTKSGYTVLYISAPDLFRALQNEYFGKGEPYKNTMQTLLEADLIIVDDLGAEFESQFNSAAMYNLLNSRLNANKPTIMSTNLSLHEIEARYSDRVASRLTTLYKCLKFAGKDIRLIKLKNNEL